MRRLMKQQGVPGVALVPLLAVMALAGLIARPQLAHGAATIVVNTTADEDVANATCSLREAIIAANTNASYKGCSAPGAGVNDTIVFNIGAGTPTINVGATQLPVITQWVTIDGGAGRVELHGAAHPSAAATGSRLAPAASARSFATSSSTTSLMTASSSTRTKSGSSAASSGPMPPA